MKVTVDARRNEKYFFKCPVILSPQCLAPSSKGSTPATRNRYYLKPIHDAIMSLYLDSALVFFFVASCRDCFTLKNNFSFYFIYSFLVCFHHKSTTRSKLTYRLPVPHVCSPSTFSTLLILPESPRPPGYCCVQSPGGATGLCL